ncbi:MAG TPA: aminoacyl-tRNA hydrolase [Vicinamibacteria bacterium]|nr:aminoacyl-tRNA hydrolase [Vicinamibacteria bacterium]
MIVGLGNPGERYAATRHNAGFLVVDLLAARAGAAGRVDDDLWVADARLEASALRLVKPLSYMNRSGPPVARLLAGLGAVPADLVVVLDDVALPLGAIRVRERGSAGGHRGLRSIVEALGTQEFPRVRIGIRQGELPDELADYVLAAVAPEDEPAFREAVVRAADAVVCLVQEGAAVAMNRFNGRIPPAPAEGPPA